MRHKQTDVHILSHFKSKTIFEAILRMENIKEIYHKYKIHEILNCDMTQALEKEIEKNHYPNYSKELFFILNLKFQMKL